MRAAQRAPWLKQVQRDVRVHRRALEHHVLIGHRIMCSFCRFAFVDRDPDSTYSELWCEHPVVGGDRFDGYREGVQMYGEDCWGFRSDVPTAELKDRDTTARVNELWCDQPAIALVDGTACCGPHLPTGDGPGTENTRAVPDAG